MDATDLALIHHWRTKHPDAFRPGITFAQAFAIADRLEYEYQTQFDILMDSTSLDNQSPTTKG